MALGRAATWLILKAAGIEGVTRWPSAAPACCSAQKIQKIQSRGKKMDSRRSLMDRLDHDSSLSVDKSVS